MSLHPSVVEAIDEIDAALFSGDSLHDDETLMAFAETMERWTKQCKVILKLISEEEPE